MQTSYNIEQGEAFAGMKVDSRFDNVESHLAEGIILFGTGVMAGYNDQARKVRTPAKIKSVNTGDADLVSLNSTAIVVNGDTMTPVVFVTDHATTMAAIAAEILTHASVLSASVTAAREITVIGKDGAAVTVTLTTTLGASQPAWTEVLSDPGVFRGLALHKHKEKTYITGVVRYEQYDGVDVCRRGLVWMVVEPSATTIAIDNAVYLNLAISGQEGKVTNVSTNNIATGGIVRKLGVGPNSEVLAQVEINLP